MTRLVRALQCTLPLALLAGCASQPPAPEPSALRRQAQAAVEAGGTRFASRHFEASARSFGSAVEIFGALDDAASEATALRNQAEALRRAGDVASASAGFERALALDRAGDDASAQARDLAGLARCSSARGEADRAVAESEQALGLAAAQDALHAAFEVDLAVYLLQRGDPGDLERALALLDSATDPANEARTRAAAHLNLGRAQRHHGAPEAAEAPLRLALEEFRALDDPEGVARTHEELGRLLRARGEAEAGRRHLEQAKRGYAFVGDASARDSMESLLGDGRE